MSHPTESDNKGAFWGSLYFRLLLYGGGLFVVLAAIGSHLHWAYSAYQNDLVRAEYVGSVIYGVTASHLTSASAVNPPNELGISVRKIGDFLDDGMLSEQSIALPEARIGEDWPTVIRIRSESREIPSEDLERLSSLTNAEEFFVELSVALVKLGEEVRLIAQLNQSIAIAFDASFWKRRINPGTILTGYGLLVILTFAILAWRLRTVSCQIRGLAKTLGTAKQEQGAPLVSSYSELRAVEQTLADIMAMKQEQDAERINQLAAMSHDLHTPFTRLRLHAEFIPDEQIRRNMLKELDEIDVMIDESMRFLKREDQREEIQVIDIVSLVQSLCDDAADFGEEVVYRDVLQDVDQNSDTATPRRIWINARPFALRRAIMNIIRNAVRYGGKAEVRLKQSQNRVDVNVDDPGSGIPEKYWGTISLPFKRVEESRSRGTGGTGLGLATAKSVIDALGGQLLFSFTEDGWFRVSISLVLSNAATDETSAVQ